MTEAEKVIVSDDVQQQADWRSRALAQILSTDDPEIVQALFTAALDMAYSEALTDAASMCNVIGESHYITLDRRYVASTLADAIVQFRDRKDLL